jgi:hypothetical protein
MPVLWRVPLEHKIHLDRAITECHPEAAKDATRRHVRRTRSGTGGLSSAHPDWVSE